MKQAIEETKHVIKQVNWGIVLLVLVMSYGFVMTNPSIGIDDENFSYFYQNNGMMISGRWGYFLLAKLFDTYTYLPVWRETLAIVCLIMAAVLFVGICEHVTQTGFSRGVATAVVCVIISFPLVARMFVYMNNCLEVTGGILFATLAAYALFCDRSPRARILPAVVAVACLVIGSAQIENTLITFYVEICLFAYLQKRDDNLWRDILYPVLLSVAATVLVRVIGRLLTYAVGVTYSNYGMGVYGKWSDIHGMHDLLHVLAVWKDNYLYWFARSFSVKLFTAAACFFLAAGIWQIVHRQIRKGLYAFGVVVASFAMYIITANGALPIRIFTVYFVAAAGCVVCVDMWLEKLPERKIPYVRGVLLAACIFCVFYGTKESNLFFRAEYLRYERDADVARNVNYDLEKLVGMTPQIPVVFLGQPEGCGTADARGEFALKTIYSDNEQGQSIRIHRFFEMLGYSYPDVITGEITPDNLKSRQNHPLIEAARRQSRTMPAYPSDGYIQVLEDKIIVKLGNNVE